MIYYIDEVQKELGNVRLSRSYISAVKTGKRRNADLLKVIDKVLDRYSICPCCGGSGYKREDNAKD